VLAGFDQFGHGSIDSWYRFEYEYVVDKAV